MLLTVHRFKVSELFYVTVMSSVIRSLHLQHLRHKLILGLCERWYCHTSEDAQENCLCKWMPLLGLTFWNSCKVNILLDLICAHFLCTEIPVLLHGWSRGRTDWFCQIWSSRPTARGLSGASCVWEEAQSSTEALESGADFFSYSAYESIHIQAYSNQELPRMFSTNTMCWVVGLRLCYSAVMSFSMCTAAVGFRRACDSGWRGERCTDRICQTGAVGPSTNQKTVLCGCWRPGTRQCLYWWACCPGGYEGNSLPLLSLSFRSMRYILGMCWISLICHGLLNASFFFFICSGLHREVYAHYAVAVFWCSRVLTWGWGNCSYRGRVCTCEYPLSITFILQDISMASVFVW